MITTGRLLSARSVSTAAEEQPQGARMLKVDDNSALVEISVNRCT
jgi:hypothetical protein